MANEPSIKRVVTFIDGQNLFHGVREAFGYAYPNYDVVALAKAACHRSGWEQNRWIKIACAFPLSPTTRNRRGIEKTDWIRIDRATYDQCLDRRDYRMRQEDKL